MLLATTHSRIGRALATSPYPASNMNISLFWAGGGLQCRGVCVYSVHVCIVSAYLCVYNCVCAALLAAAEASAANKPYYRTSPILQWPARCHYGCMHTRR